MWYTEYIQVAGCDNIPISSTTYLTNEDLSLLTDELNEISNETEWLNFFLVRTKMDGLGQIYLDLLFMQIRKELRKSFLA